MECVRTMRSGPAISRRDFRRNDNIKNATGPPGTRDVAHKSEQWGASTAQVEYGSRQQWPAISTCQCKKCNVVRAQDTLICHYGRTDL